MVRRMNKQSLPHSHRDQIPLVHSLAGKTNAWALSTVIRTGLPV